MIKIELLSQKYLNDILSYDLENGILIWKKRKRKYFKDYNSYKKWNNRFAYKPAGCISKGIMRVRIDFVLYVASRIIWVMQKGFEPDEIYHIDGDGTNIKWNNIINISRKQIQILNSKLRGRKK